MDPVPAAQPTRADRAARGAFFVALFLAIFSYPAMPVVELDASWRMVLTEGLVNGWQFGRDLVFTYGPLGFLMGNTYSGVALWPFLVWQVAMSAAFAWVIFRQGLRLSGYARAFYWGTMILLGVGYIDALIMVVMLTVSCELVRTAGEPAKPWRLAVLLLLAVLSAIKFTNLMAAGFVVLVVTGLEFWKRRPAAAVAHLLIFGGLFAAVWMLCRQNPLNFPAYLLNSLEISSGYEQTMGLPTPDAALWKGLVVFAVLVIYAVLHWLGNRDRARGFAGALVLGAFVYLNWKHGFVRADGHMIGFFICALVPITSFPALLDEPPQFHRLMRWLLVPAGVLSVLGISDALPGMVRGALSLFQDRVYANVYNTAHFDLYYQQYRERLRAVRNDYDLPKTKAVVGRASLDVLGYLQGVAIVNRFNYQPRPVIQSYSAYTPHLSELNAAHLASERAPEYVLFRLETIDERYPMLDDSRALLVFLHRYDYVHTERGFQLWRRRPGAFDAAAIAPRPLQTVDLPLGQPLDLSGYGNKPLWLEVDLHRSLLGRARDFLYKPPFVRLSLVDTKGNTTTYRMPVPLGRAGFLVNPMVEEIVGLMNFAGGTPERYVARATVMVEDEDRRFFAPTVTLKLSAVTAPRTAFDYFIEADKTRFHMFKSIPVAYEAQSPLSEAVIDDQPVMVLHARSEMTFNLRDGAQRVRGTFGYLAGAYTKGGNTDGAEFSIFWSNGGERVELFKRFLDPVRNAKDRGLQSFDVPLPQQPGGRLFLRVNPGPNGNFSWDWTAWGGIEIK